MTMTEPFNVAVIGCGLIGSRRAQEASRHARTRLAVAVDASPGRSAELAVKFGCRAAQDWRPVVADPAIQLVVVSTPNGFTAAIGAAALAEGKHVLVEKPPGRNLAEAVQLADAARTAGRTLKVGFNHRYHPAILRAHQLLSANTIGEVLNIRARYGHGGRPGYEKEWRGDPALAGGGELTDQGVHVADLIHWFAGVPSSAFALLQTAFWPIGPLEDNGFGLFRFPSGAVASLHTSWTQWKNLFSFEVFGRCGSLCIEGLGGSYGAERLITALRNPQGGAPALTDEVFDGPDLSWQREWDDFVCAAADGAPYLGTPRDGLVAMAMLDALYRSAQAEALTGLIEVS